MNLSVFKISGMLFSKAARDTLPQDILMTSQFQFTNRSEYYEYQHFWPRIFGALATFTLNKAPNVWRKEHEGLACMSGYLIDEPGHLMFSTPQELRPNENKIADGEYAYMYSYDTPPGFRTILSIVGNSPEETIQLSVRYSITPKAYKPLSERTFEQLFAAGEIVYAMLRRLLILGSQFGEAREINCPNLGLGTLPGSLAGYRSPVRIIMTKEELAGIKVEIP